MSGIVIIGAGHAAGQAAASLRQAKYAEAITIVGDEAYPPYQRPPLSKQYLSGEQGVDRVYLRAEKFYADNDIQLILNTRAEQLDPAGHQVRLSDGQTLDYEKLLLCTGSRPRKLNIAGSDLAGIHYLRTIADVDGMREAMQPGKNLVIVGGGYVGLEVAAVANSLGLNVTVLEMESRILQRVTTPGMSAFYDQLQIRLDALEATSLRLLTLADAGGVVGVEPSMLKLKGSELVQDQDELLFRLADYLVMPQDGHGAHEADARWAEYIASGRYHHRGYTIAGGSTEIQRNIIAAQGLQL